MRKVVIASVAGMFLSGAAAAWADDSYHLKIDTPAAKPSQQAVAHIHISPGTGFHVNKDYPASVKLQPPSGVVVAEAKKTIDEKELDFEVPFTAADKGKKTFTGELKFAVCSANSCDPKKEKLNFTVDVK